MPLAPLLYIDCGAGFGEGKGRGSADATSGTSNDGDFAGEIEEFHESPW